MEKLKVLIIEDDDDIVELISIAFQIRWPDCRLKSTRLGEEGVDMVETETPDIVILDLGLPDISGFKVLKQIRLFSTVPVVILTVRGEEADVVKGLEWGADEYIIKPFRQMELLSRVKTLVRRQGLPDTDVAHMRGPFHLSASLRTLYYDDNEIPLTTSEGLIFCHLMKNAGNVVTHSRLVKALWKEEYPGAVEALRVHIRRLREKIEKVPGYPKIVLTRSGVGYWLAIPD